MHENDALRKARALLAKAESTDSPQEADALTSAAAAIMAKYGLDAALVAARAEVREVPIDVKWDIAAPYASHKATILHVVAKANRCQMIQLTGRHDGLKVHVFGFQTDVEIVEMIFTSLLLQAASRMMRLERSAGRYRNDVRSRRASFLLGFATEVRARLQAESARAEAAAAPGTELVLRDRMLDVNSAYQTAYPRVRQVRMSVGSRSGYYAGRRAGAEANLHDRGTVGGRGRNAIA